MDLSPDEIQEIETALQRMEEIDAAELPAPAIELVEILSRLLDESDEDH